jgi:hypothetical protein
MSDLKINLNLSKVLFFQSSMETSNNSSPNLIIYLCKIEWVKFKDIFIWDVCRYLGFFFRFYFPLSSLFFASETFLSLMQLRACLRKLKIISQVYHQEISCVNYLKFLVKFPVNAMQGRNNRANL